MDLQKERDGQKERDEKGEDRHCFEARYITYYHRRRKKQVIDLCKSDNFDDEKAAWNMCMSARDGGVLVLMYT